MFKYQSAVELEDENSGIRESNVSGYATGNNQLPGAAEYQICAVSPEKRIQNKI